MKRDHLQRRTASSSAGALLAVAAMAGCGPGSAPASEVAPRIGFPSRYVRNVTAFEVRDSSGAAYAHPLLGGLNVPRPQLVDLEGDGRLDLFVQEYGDAVMYFEGSGPSADPAFRWRSGKFQGLGVGEWYRFVDMDADGDPDLLTEQPFSLIRYYRNDGAPGEPRFVLAADTLLDADGTPIVSDRQNIPNVTDIDCDGRLDLFIGRLEGTVTRYEAVSADSGGVPRFRRVTDRFEDIEIIGQILGSRHGANTMALADIDRDGDQDLFWGDFFEPGVLFIENTGSCENPVLRSEPVPFPVADPLATSGYNAPAFGDVDADGDLDLFVGVLGGAFNPNRTTVGNFYFLEQRDDDDFTVRTSRFITTVDVGSESYPAFADLDADGDLDLWLANKIDPHDLQTSRIYRFENVGTATAPVFQEIGPAEFSGSYHYAPAFGDLDADGDLDLLLGTWRKGVAYYRNDGAAAVPAWTLVEEGYVKLTRGSNTTPSLVDIDDDGDLDLFVGEASGALNFYRNEGSAQRPKFVLVSDEFGSIDPGRRSTPTFADLDGDGDPDLVVGAEVGGIRLFRNAGAPGEAVFETDSSLTIPVPPFVTPVFVDIDGDADLDFFTGGIAGGLVFFENRESSDG